jgi:LPXTG-motif cell wall-anchored protein
MVGVDTVGNVGKLSEIECGAPVLHTDFFELYKKFGGKGGGGICSISRGGELAPAVGLGALSLVGLGFLRRRKRND